MLSTVHPNKRAKLNSSTSPSSDYELERMVRLYHLGHSKLYRQDIMEILERNPSAGNFHFLFTEFPQAARENRENKPLLYAAIDVAAFAIKNCSISHALDASLKMVSLVADMCPIALQEREFHDSGSSPLAHVLKQDAPMELVSLLFEKCPAATGIKDDQGRTSLHLAFQTHHSQAYSDKKKEFDQVKIMVTSMLQQFPTAVRIKDDEALTPLHFAMLIGSEQDDLICLLLEKYPEAIKERDDNGYTPIDWEEDLCGELSLDDKITKILIGVHCLFEDNLNKSTAANVAKCFVSVGWWRGILLVFDLFPSAVVRFLADIPETLFPHVVAVLGRNGKFLTMWDALRNRQDVLKSA